MDQMVLRSMAKWPDVPAVYGWLSLDRRGQWRIKGERITNHGMKEFIARNYTCDAVGRWYFQNGPQRVFVKLEFLPYVILLDEAPGALGLRTMTGRPVRALDAVWLCDTGDIVIGFEGCAGAVCDRDLGRLLEHLVDTAGHSASDECIEAALLHAQTGTDTGLCLRLPTGDFKVLSISCMETSRRFAFVPDPRPAPGQPDC